MCEFKSLKGYARSLQRRNLVEDAKFIKRLAEQGGEISSKVVAAVENNLPRAEVFRRSKKSTSENQHMTDPSGQRCLRQSPQRFEAHTDLSDYQ